MMPPENLTPAQLYTELSKMPRPHRVVPFPRKKPGTDEPMGHVALVPLTQKETIESTIAADLFVLERMPGAKEGGSIGYPIAYGDECAVEQLARACREVDDVEKQVFPNAAAVRRLTADEIAVLYQAYLDVRAELGPICSAMTQEETDAWVDRLIVGGNEVDHLAFFSLEGLRTLLRTSVARLRGSRTEPSSAGSPLENSDSTRPPPSDGRLDSSEDDLNLGNAKED